MIHQLQDDNRSVVESVTPTENSESSIIKPDLNTETKSQNTVALRWKSLLLKTFRDSANPLFGPRVDPWRSQDRLEASSVTSEARARQDGPGVNKNDNKEPKSTEAV